MAYAASDVIIGKMLNLDSTLLKVWSDLSEVDELAVAEREIALISKKENSQHSQAHYEPYDEM